MFPFRNIEKCLTKKQKKINEYTITRVTKNILDASRQEQEEIFYDDKLSDNLNEGKKLNYFLSNCDHFILILFFHRKSKF